jgi:TldD protein
MNSSAHPGQRRVGLWSDVVTEFDAAAAAVQAALDAGARYADARVMHRRYESMNARNGEIDSLVQNSDAGVGVRALVGSGWGFYAVADLDAASARRAGERASEIASASALVSRADAALLPSDPVTGSWSSTCEIDPFGVSLADKGDLLVRATATIREHGADLAEGQYQAWDTSKWLVSSEGHRIDQRVREVGGGISATAIGDGETQRRSYPAARGQYGTRGWELIDELDLEGNAARVGSEARELLTAPLCPSGETTLILGGEQLALQIHESVGHAIELDRILGWEAAYAGTSWLDLAQLGSLRYGSELMNITIDPTIPGALGSFGYDDEGTPAARRDAVRNGTWVGVLAGRDSAAVAGLDYAGSVRAEGWARLPMVRMTNVGLEPGPHTFDEIVAATDDGIYMETNRSWSIDDKRLNFQFGTEVGYEVKNGQLGRLLRNPTYTGIGPRFWASMDMLSSELVAWGTPNCGKGQPGQVGHTGHPSAPARFRDVRVGVRA